MGLTDYIVIGVILLIVGLAVFYIIRAKMHGARCIGCSAWKTCGGKCHCDSKKDISANDTSINDKNTAGIAEKEEEKTEKAQCCGCCSSCHVCEDNEK